jgi:hypothetical protein
MPSTYLIELLEETLKRLESVEALSPNDQALLELKRSIVRTIAELEILKQEKSDAA